MKDNDDLFNNNPDISQDNQQVPHQQRAPEQPPSFNWSPQSDFRRAVFQPTQNGYQTPPQFNPPPPPQQYGPAPNQFGYSNQPPYFQNTYPQPPAVTPGKGLGIAGMVLGICGVVFSCAWYFGFICAIVGLVLSCVGYNKGKKVFYRNNMAVAGIVLNVISLALDIMFLTAFASFLGEFSDELMQEFQHSI